MHAYVDALAFEGLEFDVAIRTFLQARAWAALGCRWVGGDGLLVGRALAALRPHLACPLATSLTLPPPPPNTLKPKQQNARARAAGLPAAGGGAEDRSSHGEVRRPLLRVQPGLLQIGGRGLCSCLLRHHAQHGRAQPAGARLSCWRVVGGAGGAGGRALWLPPCALLCGGAERSPAAVLLASASSRS